MKTKRILAVLITLTLGLALLAPAALASEAVDPNAPIITRQPSVPAIVRIGRTLTLELQAQLPEGAQGELSVVWHGFGSSAINDTIVADGASVTIPTAIMGAEVPL